MVTKKTHDSAGRRLRFESVSTGRTVKVTDIDIQIFERLHRIGQLSSNFITDYYQAFGRNPRYGLNRLTRLSHETNNCQGGRLLYKPDWQLDTAFADNHAIIYDLSPFSESILKNEGKWRKRAIPPLVRSNSFKHDYMATSIIASIELATMETDTIRFIYGDEILDRAGKDTMVFDTEHGPLRPDGLFGLEYKDQEKTYFRFFMVEADRATEPIRGKVHGKTRRSYELKIMQYRDFIGKKKYRDQLNLTAGIMVLNVTSEVARKETIIDLTNELSNDGNNYLLFRSATHFNRFFKPSHVMKELFTGEWERAGADPFVIGSL